MKNNWLIYFGFLFTLALVLPWFSYLFEFYFRYVEFVVGP